MEIKTLFCIMIFISFSYGCVENQRFVNLENRIAAMEMENTSQFSRQKLKADAIGSKIQQDITNLEKRFDQSNSISNEDYAELKYNIQTFKEDLQRLEGLIQEINHRVENENKDLKKQLEQLDQTVSRNYEKVIRLEKYIGFEPLPENKSQADHGTSKESDKNSEQALYNFAKKLFDDGDYEKARIQFENFINKYPESDNVDNARFWIADSYYVEKWFEKAILEYQEVLEKYTDSNKLAAARLKQGYSFAELGEKANARLILQELIKKHPESKEAQYAKNKLKTLK